MIGFMIYVVACVPVAYRIEKFLLPMIKKCGSR